MELLKLENVTKKIKQKTIVDNVNLTINSGEIVGFLGPNGAGKTTTIKMIMGLFSITEGNISICGHDVRTDFENAMRNVGAIVENPDLYKRLSGRQNLEYFANFHGKEAVDNIDSVVELVKMKERIDDKVKNYSLGMRQRVGLAQAILHMPSLLVLDEPTNGLDPIGIKEMRDLLKHLAEKSDAGIFISSHLLSEMELICDRIYIIDNGVIIGEKTIGVDESEEVEVYQYTFLTSDDIAVYNRFKAMNTNCEKLAEGVNLVMRNDKMPGIIKDLVEQGILIYAVNRQHRSLEQDFISMTVGSKEQIS
ncbi:MAG: ABC transporter ATP-binding protein [Eubacteriales bacterium]